MNDSYQKMKTFLIEGYEQHKEHKALLDAICNNATPAYLQVATQEQRNMFIAKLSMIVAIYDEFEKMVIAMEKERKERLVT